MTRASTRLLRGVALTLVVLASGLACDERGGGATVVPEGGRGGSQVEPEGDPEGESMAELELRLDKLGDERSRKLGATPDDCEALCELSRSICEIKTKMCTIAEQRPTDEDYQNLCRKAKQRCSEASDTCVGCVERSGSSTCEGQP